GEDKTARVWDTETGAPLGVFRTHTGAVACAAFAPNGTDVVTGSFDKTAIVWNVTTRAQVGKLIGHSGPIRSVSYSRDGSRLITGSDDGSVKVWDAETAREMLTLRDGAAEQVQCAAISPDDTWIVACQWSKAPVI